MADNSNVMDLLGEAEKIGGSGGGGIIGYGRISVGFKVFPPRGSGIPNKDTYFEFDLTVKGAAQKAQEAATKYAGTIGANIPFNPSLQILIYKNRVKGAPRTWKDDRTFEVSQGGEYTDKKTGKLVKSAYFEIVKPALTQLSKEGKFTKFGEYWMKVSFAVEPNGKQKENYKHAEDPTLPEFVPDTVAYVSDIYPSEAAAEEAAGNGVESVTGSNGNGASHGEETWLAIKGDPDFAKALKEAAGKAVKPKKEAAIRFVAAEWEMEGSDIEAHLDELKELAI